MVSPYIEYKGDLVTESAEVPHPFVFKMQGMNNVAYRGYACPLTFVHKSVELVSYLVANN
jgi:hypothetical protein